MTDFQECLSRWPRQRIADIVANTREDQIEGILEKPSLSLADFLALLSPAALLHLERIAQKAHHITLRNFGKAINIFTPLYISDVCTNQCRYCGFSARNKQKRRHLSVDEAVLEARALSDAGFQHILLLTGDARQVSSPEYIADVVRRIKPLFASIGIEVYALSAGEYAMLIAAGVDSMTMFQETYNRDLYAWLHPAGPKRDYAWRVNAPGRAAAAGIHSVGIGALLGLDEFVYDAFATGLHAWFLQRRYPAVDISVSIPRICPHEGDFDVTHAVDDVHLVQYVLALRAFLPRAGITCSSRESAHMRNHLLPLGVTRVSAGVSTAVGGRATEDTHNPGQFEISDHRSLPQMAHDLAHLGYQPVLKDWESPDA